MKLMGLSKFREKYFDPDTAPTMTTLRAWVDAGEIPGGRKIGHKYYVDVHLWEAGGEPLIAKVLEET